jgi:exodeoxyribonuclease V alpha subunit
MASPKADRPWENESPSMSAAIPERRPATEEISGLIERVTFHHDESGFCVLRVKARGQREETTVVGSLPSVTAGRGIPSFCRTEI